jgi:hypothetical protein
VSAERIVLQTADQTASRPYAPPTDANLSGALRSLGFEATPEQVGAARLIAEQGGVLTRASVARAVRELGQPARPMATDPPRDLGAWLRSVGLPDVPVLRSLVQEMTARSLPLAPEVLRDVGAALQQLGATEPPHAAAAAFLLSAEVPITPATLRAALQALEGQAPRAAVLTQLADALDALATAMPARLGTDAESTEAPGASPDARTPQGAARSTEEAGRSAAARPEPGRLEADAPGLVRPAASDADDLRLLAARLRDLASLGPSDRGQTLRALRTVFEANGISLESRLMALAEGAGDPQAATADPRAVLARAAAATALAPGADRPSSPGPASVIASAAPQVADALQAQQLANVVRDPATSDGWYTFRAPVTLPSGTERQVEIRVQPRPGTGEIDARHVRMALALEHDDLGRVEVGLQVSGKSISCAIECASGEALERARERWVGLRDGLRSLGYGVAQPRLALAEARGPTRELASSPSPPAAPGGVDARA